MSDATKAFLQKFVTDLINGLAADKAMTQAAVVEYFAKRGPVYVLSVVTRACPNPSDNPVLAEIVTHQEEAERMVGGMLGMG